MVGDFIVQPNTQELFQGEKKIKLKNVVTLLGVLLALSLVLAACAPQQPLATDEPVAVEPEAPVATETEAPAEPNRYWLVHQGVASVHLCV